MSWMWSWAERENGLIFYGIEPEGSGRYISQFTLTVSIVQLVFFARSTLNVIIKKMLVKIFLTVFYF